MRRKRPAKRSPAPRRKKAKPVRRAVARRKFARPKPRRVQGRSPRKPVGRQAKPAARPSTDRTAFWQGGDRSSFQVEIAPATVPGGTLMRLGPPPLGSASGRVERTLRRTYAAAAAAALALARR